MRIATYNMCFGLKANTALDAYNASWGVVHGHKSAAFIQARIDLSSLFKALEEVNPDIVILNEAFDSLTSDPIREKLFELGFVSVHVGNSGHHEKPLCISTLVATKLESVDIGHPLTFAKGMPGSGGGAVGAHIPSLDLTLLGCHLAFKKRYIQDHVRQLDAFYEKAKKTSSRVIFAGDFNRLPEFFEKKTEFGKHMRHAITQRTFPSFSPWYKPLAVFSENIVTGPVDNMYYEGLAAVSEKVMRLSSDHKMAVAEFKVI